MGRPKKTALSVNQHFNSKLTPDIADKVANAVMQNKTLEKICEETGLQEQAAFKYVRGVKVDIDYPETREAWNEAVQSFLGIAIYKATKRLADTGMEEMNISQLPVAMAISLDKKLLMEGTPTNITASMNISVSHKDLLNELKPKSNDIDV